ncbi:phage major capsid protein [Brevibacterium salitolerans]|uniref:Phage capsid-like C-terminal domain-containing protein n=1 Tax=Brevibacterium salitolerans TaxID=1403566 RepID=A0ABN2WHM6_9MICO
MALYTTTSGVSAISPDQIEQLIVGPVEAASIAIQTATLVATQATETRIPRVLQDPTAAWTAEGAEIGTSDPMVDDIVVTPRKLAGLTIVSNEALADTNPAADSIVGDGLTRDIAKKVDVAFFGSNGGDAVQPEGLEDLTGVTTITGPTAWEDADPFAEALSNAEGLGLAVNSFVANPADALALAQLKESAASRKPLLGPDPTNPTRRALQGVPLLVSPAVTAGTVWGIPQVRAVIVRRNDVDLQVDRSAYFTSDRTAIRATMRVGFAFPQPAAIQKIELGSAGGEG